MSPQYAILRVKRLKTIADLDAATRHGRREDTGTHFDPDRTPYNEHFAATRCVSAPDWAENVACGALWDPGPAGGNAGGGALRRGLPGIFLTAPGGTPLQH